MNSPFTGKPMHRFQELRSLKFRKECFEIRFQAFRCEDTGELFESDELAMLNYNQLVNQYRSKYNIPFPEQIVAIREKYKISAKRMSAIMGFGTNVYRQYEGGEVPSLSNAKLIQLAADPEEFQRLVKLSAVLSEKDKAKIYTTIACLVNRNEQEKEACNLKKYLLGDYLPCSMSGYKAPSYEKFAAIVVFFSERLQPWKTKLNKLLFYADFMMFRDSGFSISGTKYRAIGMGPVPENFNSVFDYLVKQKCVHVEYKVFSNGIGERFTPRADFSFNEALFSTKELDVLNTVALKFKQLTTQEIIDLSHQENAWLVNCEGHQLIDYSAAFDLKVV